MRTWKAWREHDPERWRVYRRAKNSRRRARQMGAVGILTYADLRRIMANQRGRCYWCRTDAGREYTIDHVIPLSKGGRNDAGNVVIACRACNQSKRDMMPFEFAGVML